MPEVLGHSCHAARFEIISGQIACDQDGSTIKGGGVVPSLPCVSGRPFLFGVFSAPQAGGANIAGSSKAETDFSEMVSAIKLSRAYDLFRGILCHTGSPISCPPPQQNGGAHCKYVCSISCTMPVPRMASCPMGSHWQQATPPAAGHQCGIPAPGLQRGSPPVGLSRFSHCILPNAISVMVWGG